MTRLIGVSLAGCALCVTPVVADEDVYDGPTAIRPLTVVPHSTPPNTLCDFEHQCYPKKGGPMVPAPVAPPVEAAKPDAPLPEVLDEPIVATWRGCIGRALQIYEQSHDLHALEAATGSCQVRLEEQGGENYAGAITTIRNVKDRCIVPATSFCEYADTKPRKTSTWFAQEEDRPLFDLAGLWTPWRARRATPQERSDRGSSRPLSCGFEFAGPSSPAEA